MFSFPLKKKPSFALWPVLQQPTFWWDSYSSGSKLQFSSPSAGLSLWSHMQREVVFLGIKELNHLKAHKFEPAYNTTLENELDRRAENGAQL